MTPAITTGQALAWFVLVALALFLLALGAAALGRPPLARRFLSGFATTPARHVAELLLRTTAGAAFWLLAPRLPATALFQGVAVVLLATTALMAALPWRWHQRFAGRSVPAALAFLPWLGLASLALGFGLIAALWLSARPPWTWAGAA